MIYRRTSDTQTCLASRWKCFHSCWGTTAHCEYRFTVKLRCHENWNGRT